MKLALYLPNFRDEVTVKEIEDLTALAEDRDFDSVWTLDRVFVPESSDRGELQYPFGMMEGLPNGLPVVARGKWLQGYPLLPWLAAKTSKIRFGMSITNTPFRGPAVLATELATIDQLSGGRLNVGVGSGWMPEEFAASSVPQLFPRRHAHVRDTLEIMKGIWENDVYEHHSEFADFEPGGFGHKPVQTPLPIFFSGLKDPKRSAKRIAKYGLNGWIGIQDTPEDIKRWKGEMERELNELGRGFPEGFEMSTMIWTVITDEPLDQSDNGKVTNLLAGTAQQIEDRLKAYKEAGLTMPLIWPPFRDVPTSKTMDDLKRINDEILPKVNAS
jgi:alkanesulfonate monooxygenase SsuD/methylene tetrahydromethanopterin reductase-like flavin-dependent oxidoreductase (luciferase family)